MAEILIKAASSPASIDLSIQNWRSQPGDIVEVRPDGTPRSRKEHPPRFLILRVDGDHQQLKSRYQEVEYRVDENGDFVLDAEGWRIPHKYRRFRIDLDGLKARDGERVAWNRLRQHIIETRTGRAESGREL